MCHVLEEAQAEAEPRSSFRLSSRLPRSVLVYCRAYSVGKRCMKCERSAVTTARTKDPFCKSVASNIYASQLT